MDLSRFPRTPLVHSPTPLEPMTALSKALNGPDLFVKRDDCTGLAMGGNKSRKLEFSLGDALDKGSDLIITSGATQSNHVRQTAAACAKLGLAFRCVIANPLDRSPADYYRTGNVLLDKLFGAEINVASDTDEATARAVKSLVEAAQREGCRSYVVPLGASDAIGSLGYVDCAREILVQCDAFGIAPSHIVVATGSAGTHAGLLVGLRLLGSAIKVIGVAVSGTSTAKEERVRLVAETLTALLRVKRDLISREDIRVLDHYIGGGYAMPAKSTVLTLRLVARTEGLLLDPVYTGKAMDGLIDLVRRNELQIAKDVIFLHTGGSPALFAYLDEFGRVPETSATLQAG
ncbi:MAG: D-cysteine desulfhydrase family protein [Parvularculaceae bacterium]